MSGADDAFCAFSGKIKYATRRAAADATRVLKSKRGHYGLNVFKCSECRCYHVGRARKNADKSGNLLRFRKFRRQ